jgi:Molecular chaperone GrpE (heat shock protein)
MTKKHNDAEDTVAVTQENAEVGAIPVEQVMPADGGEVSPDQDNPVVAKLEQELEQAKQAKDEYYNRMLRLQADLEDFRRRSRQELEQLTLFAGEDLLKKILPVLDSLERAVGCFTEKTDNKSWVDGVDLTLKQFQNILKSEGLEVVPAMNNPFDPQVHEAVLQEPQEQITEPTVIEEMQKGYRYKGKLLRPALVKVAVPQ